MTKPIGATVAEVKACWEQTPNASSRVVASKLTAAGKPISNKTVAKWKREGWPGAADGSAAVKKAEKAVETAEKQLAPIAAQATGDANAAPAPATIVDDRGTSNSALLERTLRKLILGAERFAEELAANMPTHALAAEATAKSLVSAANGINTAAAGLASILPQLREGEMKTVEGAVVTKTIEQKIESDPLRASLEAYGKAVDQTQDAVHAEPAG